jgi:hypothetical protein
MFSLLTAADAASYVLAHVELFPSSIYTAMSPLASPSLFSCHIAAPSLPIANVVYDQYVTYWVSDQLRGIEQWVSVLFLLRKQFRHLHLLLTWKLFRGAIASVLPASMQVEQFQIPALSIAPDSTVHFRLMGLNEYIRVHNLDPNQFMNHIIQIVLFGFVVSHESIEAFRAHTVIQAYLEYRLRQGVYDRQLRSTVSMTSRFDSSANRPSNDPAYLRIAASIAPFLEQRKLFPTLALPAEIQQDIQNVHSLGPVTSSVKRLSRLGALTRMRPSYLKYLNRYLPPNTEAYGMKVFLDHIERYEFPIKLSQHPSRYEGPAMQF